LLSVQPAPEILKPFLRDIGQGPKSCRDLTREEARVAMAAILAGQATPAQVGAFLLVERFKGETPEELLGFTEAVRATAHTLRPNTKGLLDVGSPYDGRNRSPVVSPAASLVAAAAGVPVVMHGEKDMPPKGGVAVGDVLEGLGLSTDATPQQVCHSLERAGFGYMRQARFLPCLYALKGLRREIALRSALHTVEKISNLAHAPYLLTGLAHLPYLEKLLAAIKAVGFQRIMLVQGMEGSEDAPTHRATRVIELGGEGPQEYRLNPKALGLTPASPEAMAGDAVHNARLTIEALTGRPGPFKDLVLLNAALRIYLAERASSIEEGLAAAQQAVDSGAAWAKLEELRSLATLAD